MALTEDEQRLVDVANASLPAWFRGDDRIQEELAMLAKENGQALTQIKFQFDQCYISLAAGPTSTEPDWLGLLANERGTFRQEGESTDQLRARLAKTPIGVIRKEILQAVVDAVTAAGLDWTKVVMVELPRDQAFLGTWSQDGGTGGQFVKEGDTMVFYPSAGFAYPPFFKDISGEIDDRVDNASVPKGTSIVIASATDSGNVGTFPILGLRGDGAIYSNSAGTGGSELSRLTDTAANWLTKRHSRKGQNLDGWPRTFLDRGRRLWRGAEVGDSAIKVAPGGFVLILPYAATETLRLSVAEMCRKNKAAGFLAIVERRTEP